MAEIINIDEAIFQDDKEFLTIKQVINKYGIQPKDIDIKDIYSIPSPTPVSSQGNVKESVPAWRR